MPAPATSHGPPDFAATFHDNVAYVWRAIRALGVWDADVADVSQEVFLVVHRRLPEFRGESALRTWIYGICVRVASEHRRRAYRRRERPAGDSMPETSIAGTLDEDVENRRALRRLDAVLDELDDAKRAVFVLYELEGVSMNDVALAVGCPVQTAYARLYAARKVVRAAFTASPEGSTGGANSKEQP